MGPFAAAFVALAASPPPDKDVKAGWVAFALFIALVVAVFLLWLSFRKQLKKIDFEEEPDEPDEPDERTANGNGSPSASQS